MPGQEETGRKCFSAYREELHDDVVVSLISGTPDLFTLLSVVVENFPLWQFCCLVTFSFLIFKFFFNPLNALHCVSLSLWDSISQGLGHNLSLQ